MRYMCFVLLALGLVVLASGCIFNPKTDDEHTGGGTGGDYLEPISPENVLLNLQKAYIARDSTHYKACYDSLLYVGSSRDEVLNTTTTFLYDAERAHIKKLAEVTTIVSMVFEIGLQSTWQRLPSDDASHPEWILIQINFSKIEIYDGPTLYSAQSTNPVTFSFAPTTTNGKTTWKIVRWNEVASSA